MTSSATITATVKAAPRPIAGVFWMFLTGLCFVAVTALVKFLGPEVPAPQAAFLRYLLGLVFLLPMIGALRRTRLTRRMWGIFAARGAVHTIAVALWFFAMTMIPLAEVTAMNYLSPIYVTLGAALFLGERLAMRRVLAVAIALAGAVIILRPGFRELNLGHLAMLGTAFLFGISYLLAKTAADEVSPAVVVGMLSITVTIGLFPIALAVWTPVSLWDLAILFGVASFATAGHFAMTLAFRAAPVTVTQPVTFLQLVWAVLLGYFVFDESVDTFVVLGGVVILASVSFITFREAQLRRRAITPPDAALKL
ncbi:EamA domain-containing membrane protein RarD [Poseidonocella pacifica]|uniref:EamA domain-containing membrane protein RarD n=1 Tax=Poseidonocella pacifica TaxID=871651 RepID=A0A1I0X6D7_9RHOB|nr:DMT family transporter [Poseidonocella pacifica]SFA96555.1 EamA domain-containing membrane protein RarD [Poseidonocella pacifica]